MSTTILLSKLGSGGFEIKGGAAYDFAGAQVSTAGDVNGDGIADVVVGAPGASARGEEEGAAYIIFGRKGGIGDVDLSALAPEIGFTVFGDVQSDAMGAVSNAGDVNGDGIDDLILGAAKNDDGGRDAGAAYVIFGKTGGFDDIDLTHFDPADGFVIQGFIRFGLAGSSVSAAGDVNGDGFADVIVGAPTRYDSGPGNAYVVYGKADGFDRVELANLSPADGFAIGGVRSYDGTGGSVSSAGDINGDGFDDVIVGTPSEKEAFVIFGGAAGRGDVDLASLDPADGFALVGGGNGAGDAVSSAGDVNGDGHADLIVGAPFSGYSNGLTYVVYGKPGGLGTLDLSRMSEVDGFVLTNSDDRSESGVSVSSAGDVNGDGFDDLIVGAERAGRGSTYFGSAYIVYGHAGVQRTIDLNTLTNDQGFALRGAKHSDFAGGSVSAAGDVNGDGFADVIVGARYNDDGDLSAGAAYVVYGVAPTEAVTRYGTEIANTIHGGTGDDRLEGRGGDDVLIAGAGNDMVEGQGGADDLTGDDGDDKLNGGAGDDVMHGGDGADRLAGGRGTDQLYGGAGQDQLSGGAGADLFHFSFGGTAADPKAADRIADFSQAQQDRIDLSDYDADPGTRPTDPFTFVGTAAFSGAAGELRYKLAGGDTLVSGDTNGDKAADFTIRLTGAIPLTADDFLFALPPGGGAMFRAAAELHGDPHLHLA